MLVTLSLIALTVLTATVAVAAQRADINLTPPSDETAPTTPTLYQISPLSPDIIAAINQAKSYAVIDANGNSMPVQYQQQHRHTHHSQRLASIYNWEDKQQLQALQTHAHIQVRTQGVEVVVDTARDNVPDTPVLDTPMTHTETLAPQLTPSQTWLVALPNYADNQPKPTNFDAVLYWQESNKKLTATLLGSNDLVSWTPLREVALASMQASNGQSALQQNRISNLSSDYAYWQLKLSKPISLSKVELGYSQREPEEMAIPVTFNSVAANTWQLDLPAPWMIWGIQFDVPNNQVWQIDIAKPSQKSSEHTIQWQSVVKTQLYQLDDRHKNCVGLPSPMQIAQLQLTGQIPTDTHINAQALIAKQSLTFLAQGAAPYTLVLYQANDKQPATRVTLPSQFSQSSTNVLPAHLLPLQQGITQSAGFKRWLLWGVLVLVVLLLAVMARYLVKSLG